MQFLLASCGLVVPHLEPVEWRSAPQLQLTKVLDQIAALALRSEIGALWMLGCIDSQEHLVLEDAQQFAC